MAHINAYCRGNRYHYLEELRDAFQMLRENPNIISDSHMAVNNGTSGACRNGIPCDAITVNCLKMFGYESTQAGLAKAMKDGTVCAIASLKEENVLLNKEDAFQYWSGRDTNINVSFPANLAPVASACLTERRIPGGSPLITPVLPAWIFVTERDCGKMLGQSGGDVRAAPKRKSGNRSRCRYNGIGYETS